VVWEGEGRWKKRTVHLGRQKEAFDAEMYAMSEAMKIADEMAEKEEVTRVTLFTDSQATLRRIQSDEPGPGQVLAQRTMNWADALAGKYIQVEYRWVPAHMGIEGNEEADQQATKVAYKHCGSYTETQNPLPFLDYVSFSHISRRLSEAKWEEIKEETKEMGKKSKHSYQYDLVKRGGNSSVSNGSKLPGQFRVRFHPKPDCGNGSYHTKIPDCWKWAGFTTKNPTFQVHNFGSN